MIKIRNTKFHLTPYLFLMPLIIIFAIFFIYPTFFGWFASFTRWNLFGDPEWVGLNNFRTILFDDTSTFHFQFWNGMKNTFTFVLISVPLQVLIPLLLATALYAKPPFRLFFQSVFYLPNLFSVAAVVLTWVFIFNRTLGLFINIFNVDVNWYGEQPFAWLTILIPTLWWLIGINLIIYVAALGGIDKEILEASEIDGARPLKRFFYIMLPLIRFPLIYTIITSIISQFNIFAQPLMLTGGGPSESTFVLLMYIRQLVFVTGNPIAGISSAMATSLGLTIAVVSIAQLVLLRKQD